MERVCEIVQQLDAMIRAVLERWRTLIPELNIKPD
jgi:hypothetical protein